jgi:serine/threonine protein kinase/tetratricopeptide (TPR) repeat protein
MTEQSSSERSIFESAIDKSSPAARAAFLDGACAGNPRLRAEVDALLAAHDRLARAAAAGQAPPPAATVAEASAEGRGTVIGPYKLLEQIGEGGMGLVFVAEQQHPVRRKVALKVIKPGMDTRQVVARFEAERQALALMDHPHIAQVHDGGETASGRPYFVMELVRGVPITAYCDQNQVAVRERLELFVHVCQAVQHAHQKGIIHRDIKPSNVLVLSQDGTPVVKVIDFGVAKAIGQQLTDKTLYTHFSQLVGTPLYTSPEQAGQSGVDVDTRSDIYSLGVLLYELLTGTTPFGQERLKTVGFDEICRILREEEPPKPSTRISTLGRAQATVSANRQSDPKRLRQLVRGELDWIVMKALEKDRNRRYETASAFAADVQRYLKDEPVQACPPSVWYRFRKFGRRHKVGLAMAGLALSCLVLVGSGIGWVAGDAAARHAKAAAGFDDALADADAALKREDWPAARAARDRAHDLLAAAGADALRPERLRRVEADLLMAQTLELARLEKASGVTQDHFDWAKADPLYAAAFESYGLPVLALEPNEAAERIAASAVREQLLAALRDWAAIQPDLTRGKRLQALLQVADRDPWRRRLADAIAQKDVPGLSRLVKQPEILGQPPEWLAVTAAALERAGFSGTEEFWRQAQQRHPADFWINHELAFYLHHRKPPRLEEAVGFYRVALALRPHSPGVYFALGTALQGSGRLDEAIAAYKEALRLKPDYVSAHSVLGSALQDKGRLDEAIAEHREALRLKPEYAVAHSNLGAALWGKGQLDEAIAEYREALRIKKDYATAHYSLGNALRAKGQLDEAIAEYREALRLEPDYASAHNNLGIALRAKGQLDEAIAEYREAFRLKKDYATAHNNFGAVLHDKGQLEEAIAEYREALRIKKDYAEAHNNLGNALRDKGQLDEAIAEYREALRFKSDFAEAHYNLGNALWAKGQLDEAIAAYREAVRLKKDFHLAHNILGNALRAKGQLDEAIAAYREALRLKKDSAGARNLARALKLVQVRDRLQAVLQGKDQPRDANEYLAFAEFCQRPFCQQYAAAVHFYAGAFAAAPNLVDDLHARDRYYAACAAALAGCGQGKDADKLDEPERARLRRQAVTWLQADLAAWRTCLEKDPNKAGPAVRQTMQHWQGDADFAGVRGPEALARLPEAERPVWQKLWEEVAALQKRAAGSK